MNFILKSVTVQDTNSEFNGKCVDILIENGTISRIAQHIDKDVSAIDYSECYVSPGWFDFSAHFNDPGLEYKEGIENGLDLLVNGGFTGAGVLPNTKPVIQRKTDISYIDSKCRHHLADLYAYGAVTIDCNGEELTEMIDMQHAGAIAFTDGLNSVGNADILLKTLLYLQRFDGILIQRPEDARLNMFGSMHEGKVSTILGLKGMPSLSEVLTIQRDLRILEYTGGKIHFSALSTAESVELIKAAKDKGLKVTCDVALHQLLLNEEAVMGYDTNVKVNPPLRSEQDRKALIKGVKDGVIDVISSHHLPQDEENKKMEFDLADYGMIGLQTFYPLINRLTDDVPFDVLLKCFTENPRRILGIDTGSVSEGNVSNLTVFNKNLEWTFDKSTNLSKSGNSPFLGQSMKGKVVGLINGDKSIFNL